MTTLDSVIFCSRADYDSLVDKEVNFLYLIQESDGSLSIASNDFNFNQVTVVRDSSPLNFSRSQVYLVVDSQGRPLSLKVRDFGDNKNLIPFPFVSKATSVVRGVTISPRDNGTIVVNGTAQGGDVWYLISSSLSIVEGETYYMSGCPEGGGWSTYRMRTTPSIDDNGQGVSFTATKTDPKSLTYLYVRNGATVSNLVFRPSVRKFVTVDLFNFTLLSVTSEGEYALFEDKVLGDLKVLSLTPSGRFFSDVEKEVLSQSKNLSYSAHWKPIVE